MLNKLTSLLVVVACFVLSASAQVKCKLKGNLVDRTSKAVLLIKAKSEIRIENIRIPVVDNHFEYILETEEIEAYELIVEEEYLKSVYTPTLFFPDNDEISFTLYPQNIAYEKNTILGGDLNRAYAEFKSQMMALFNPKLEEVRSKRKELEKRNDYYSPEIDSLMSLIRRTKDIDQRRPLYMKQEEMQKSGADLTANGKKVYAEQQMIIDERNDWRYDYIRTHISLLSYFLIMEDIYYRAREEKKIAEHIFEVYPLYTNAFPTHKYTKRIRNEIAGLNLRRPGQSFVDFTAPDLSGKSYTFSTLLNGKVTLLDLWGSWCGPCRAATRTMLPVYTEFKNKGLQVIGVAREFHDLSELKTALKKEKYPWLTLVELDDKNEIWSKYNISNSGGAIFLFDKEGKILAVNPTAEEVRKILSVKL